MDVVGQLMGGSKVDVPPIADRKEPVKLLTPAELDRSETARLKDKEAEFAALPADERRAVEIIRDVIATPGKFDRLDIDVMAAVRKLARKRMSFFHIGHLLQTFRPIALANGAGPLADRLRLEDDEREYFYLFLGLRSSSEAAAIREVFDRALRVGKSKLREDERVMVQEWHPLTRAVPD